MQYCPPQVRCPPLLRLKEKRTELLPEFCLEFWAWRRNCIKRCLEGLGACSSTRVSNGEKSLKITWSLISEPWLKDISILLSCWLRKLKLKHSASLCHHYGDTNWQRNWVFYCFLLSEPAGRSTTGYLTQIDLSQWMQQANSSRQCISWRTVVRHM